MKRPLDLFLISLLALYFEILFIRLIPSSVPLVSYFTNTILMCAFLGLGLGCMLAKKKYDLMILFPFSVFTMAALVLGFNHVDVRAGFFRGEHMLGAFNSQGVNFLVIITVFFVFTTLVFVPLGQKLGACLSDLGPLAAYSINIAGGIFGVILFTFLSYRMFEPAYWFLTGLTITLWFFSRAAAVASDCGVFLRHRVPAAFIRRHHLCFIF